MDYYMKANCVLLVTTIKIEEEKDAALIKILLMSNDKQLWMKTYSDRIKVLGYTCASYSYILIINTIRKKLKGCIFLFRTSNSAISIIPNNDYSVAVNASMTK